MLKAMHKLYKLNYVLSISPNNIFLTKNKTPPQAEFCLNVAIKGLADQIILFDVIDALSQLVLGISP